VWRTYKSPLQRTQTNKKGEKKKEKIKRRHNNLISNP